MPKETYAFIVRVWSETPDQENNPVTWRGSVHRVGGDKRFYFQEFDLIGCFIRELIYQADDWPPADPQLLADSEP